MSTYEHLKCWLAEALSIPKEQITPDATFGDLFRARTRRSEENITPDPDSIADRLSPDSLDIAELAMGLEEEFDIEVPDEEADVFMSNLLDPATTVRQLVAFIEKHQQS